MNKDLEDLKAIVFDGGFDNDSRLETINLEQRLTDAAARERLAEHPAIKPFIEYLKARRDAAELLLTTDRTLNDKGRDALFERIDVCGNFLNIFSADERQSVEKSIREALNRAKTS